jgi:hypothetical protein
MNVVLDREVVRLIQASILADAGGGREVEQVGPFVATFNRKDGNPYLNYAVPLEEARPSQTEVQALTAAYRERQRRPRLEYIPSLAPEVEQALREQGFEQEGRLPLMIAESLRLQLPATGTTRRCPGSRPRLLGARPGLRGVQAPV